MWPVKKNSWPGDLGMNDDLDEIEFDHVCVELDDGDISELILPNDVGFNNDVSPVSNSSPVRNSWINQRNSSPSPVRNSSTINQIESSPSPPTPPPRMEKRPSISVESSPVQHQTVATSTSFVDPPIEEDNSKELKPERLASIDGELEKVKNGIFRKKKSHLRQVRHLVIWWLDIVKLKFQMILESLK
jgi:hypothetical protein